VQFLRVVYEENYPKSLTLVKEHGDMTVVWRLQPMFPQFGKYITYKLASELTWRNKLPVIKNKKTSVIAMDGLDVHSSIITQVSRDSDQLNGYMPTRGIYSEDYLCCFEWVVCCLASVVALSTHI